MAKGIGPLLLLGGAAALFLSTRKKDEAVGPTGGEIVAEGNRANNLNIPMYYRVVTTAGIPGFAVGEGNVAYIPEIANVRDYERDMWIQLSPQESIEDAEAVALSKLEEEGFIQEL